MAVRKNDLMSLLEGAEHDQEEQAEKEARADQAGTASRCRLQKQLIQSLNKLLPDSTPLASSEEKACMIRGALEYMKSLEWEVQGVQDDLKEPTTLLERTLQRSSIEVDVSQVEEKLSIRVSCPKKASLLVDLMVILENTGLLLDHVNASCVEERLLFEASAINSQNDGVDISSLKYDLMVLIHARCLN